MGFCSSCNWDLRDRCHRAKYTLAPLPLNRGQNLFISKVIIVLKANMVCVIFFTIFGVLCSESSVLNAPVLRQTIRGFRHHEYTGE